jgi:putative DNA primase/helicase
VTARFRETDDDDEQGKSPMDVSDDDCKSTSANKRRRDAANNDALERLKSSTIAVLATDEHVRVTNTAVSPCRKDPKRQVLFYNVDPQFGTARDCPFAKRRHKSNTVYYMQYTDNPIYVWKYCHDDECKEKKMKLTICNNTDDKYSPPDRPHQQPVPPAPLPSLVENNDGDLPDLAGDAEDNLEDPNTARVVHDDIPVPDGFFAGCPRDDEYAEVAFQAIGDEVVIVHIKDGSGYWYDSSTLLWQPAKSEIMRYQVKERLKLVIEEMLATARAREQAALQRRKQDGGADPAAQGNLKETDDVIGLLKTQGKLMDVSQQQSLFVALKPRCYDEKFEEKLNAAPHLLAFKGGKVVDLRTRAIRERTKADMMSFECPGTVLPPEHPLTNVRATVTVMMNGRADAVEYLQRVLGYLSTGETIERMAFIFYGPRGSSGKSLLFECFLTMMGDLAAVAPKDMVFEPGGRAAASSHEAHLSQLLKHPRALVMMDTKEKARLNSMMLKHSTGDRITFRGAYEKEPVTIRCGGKIVILSNYVIGYDAADEATQARLNVLLCPVQLVDHPTLPYQRKKDETVKENMLGVWFDEFVTFVVDGAVAYYRDRLANKPVCIDANDEFRVDACPEHDWSQQRLENVADDQRTLFKDLFDAYVRWCTANGKDCVSANAFGRFLKSKYVKKESNGNTYYHGVVIKDDEPIDDL